MLTYWYEIQKIIVITPISNIYGLDENVYIVYLLSPLTTTDFRISDGILKVVNAIIVLIIIMKDKPLVCFSVGVHIE